MSDAPLPYRANPWLGAWFRPDAAIDAVLAKNLVGTSLLIALAAGLLELLAAISSPIFFRVFPLANGLVELIAAISTPKAYIAFPSDRSMLLFELLVVLAILVAVAGVYYLNGWILNALAHFLGGRGSAPATRAAYAWSSIPLLVANLVALAIAWVAAVGAAPEWLGAMTGVRITAWLWSTAVYVAMLGRAQGFGKFRACVSILVGSALPWLVVTLGVRAFLIDPLDISSASMAPSLQTGDYVFVNKADYGYSQYSFPAGLVPFEGRLLPHAPKRGDVVELRHKNYDNPSPFGGLVALRDGVRDNSEGIYVERIVGLPGEKIQLKAGRLYIDGQIVERRPVELDKPETAPTFEEILPGGVVHRIQQLQRDDGPASNTDVYEVPPGAYFVLGDNRDNAWNSRFPSFGFVPFENLIGRVALIYFSRAPEPATPRFERIGAWVR